MEAKGEEFHARVREMFLAQAKADLKRFAVVDARGEAEQVQANLRKSLLAWTEARKS